MHSRLRRSKTAVDYGYHDDHDDMQRKLTGRSRCATRVDYVPLHKSYNTYNQDEMHTDHLPGVRYDKATMTAWDDITHRQQPQYHPQTDRTRKNNYYERLVLMDEHNRRPKIIMKPSVSSSVPVFRAGRLGAPWRHVKQCTGNLGNHICFIDGTVKETDVTFFPPYGYSQPMPTYSKVAPSWDTSRQRQAQGDGRYYGKYNDHARNGFKYWNEERRPSHVDDRHRHYQRSQPVWE